MVVDHIARVAEAACHGGIIGKSGKSGKTIHNLGFWQGGKSLFAWFG